MGFPLEPTNSPEPSEEQGQGNSVQDNINPAWNDVLGLIPETLHSQITPHFSKWDKGVQERFQQVHSQYEPYKAYQTFVESQISPDDLRMGYGLLQAVYQKPQEVIQAIQQTFNLTPQQTQALLEQQGEAEDEENVDPYANIPPQFMEEFMRVKQQADINSRILLQQRDAQLQQQQSDLLDQAINGLKAQYGNFDDQTERVILSRAAQMNGDLEGAAREVFNLIEAQLAARNRPTPPKLLGQNSGPIPENHVDPRKLNDRDTKNLVAEMLKHAAATTD